MSIGAGGLIKQSIVRDTGDLEWLKSETKTVNIQIVNSGEFRAITSRQPPEPPIDIETYEQYGYPFFTIYEEPSYISGDFSSIRSINQIDKVHDPNYRPQTINLFQSERFLNPEGPRSEFRDLKTLEGELLKRGSALF
jgi:hypothetical protein